MSRLLSLHALLDGVFLLSFCICGDSDMPFTDSNSDFMLNSVFDFLLANKFHFVRTKLG